MNYPHSGRFAGLILAVLAALLGACGESPSGPTAGAPGDDEGWGGSIVTHEKTHVAIWLMRGASPKLRAIRRFCLSINY